MIENPYYSQEPHGPYELHDIGDLDLEEGGTIRGCKLAVATHGKLNAAKDNAILVPTWLSLSETQSGWQVESNWVMLSVDERCLQLDLVGADRIVPVASVAASRDLGASSSTQRAAT